MVPLKVIFNTGVTFCRKNASTILSGFALIGVVYGEYLAYKAGENVAYDLADEYERNGDFDKKTKAKIVVKRVAPVAAVGGLTMAAIISSHIIDIRKMRAMAASYALLAESAEVYRHKVIERIGEHKHDEVLGDIANDEIVPDVERNDIQIVSTQGGSFLFKDSITKQYFRADADYVRKQQNRVNDFYKQGENFVTVSEWYGYLGLESPGEPVAGLGWPASCGIKFELSSCVCPNGEPGYYILYDVMPMTEEEAEIYDRNHYISTGYDY